MEPLKHKEVALLFYREFQLFTRFARTKLPHNWFDDIFVEQMLFKVFNCVLEGTQIKVGFQDEDHIKKYFIVAIKKRALIEYQTKRPEMVYPQLSAKAMSRNMDFARQIIDANRSKGKEIVEHDQTMKSIFEKQKQPYVFMK